MNAFLLWVFLSQLSIFDGNILVAEKPGSPPDSTPITSPNRWSEKEKKEIVDTVARLDRNVEKNCEWMIDFIERHRNMVNDPDRKLRDLRSKLIALRASRLNPRVYTLELLIDDIGKKYGGRSALEQYQLKMWKGELQELKRIQRIAPMPHEPKHKILQPLLRVR